MKSFGRQLKLEKREKLPPAAADCYLPTKIMTGHKSLKVYQLSYRLAMEIFEITKSFPKEERYSLTDQMRRSSRSIAANIAEAYRKRQYSNAFVAELSDSDAECAETQTWLDISRDCG